MQRVKLRDIRIVMMLVNLIAVLFVTVFIFVTTEQICDYYNARGFLDTVRQIPRNPFWNVVIATGLYLSLTASFVVREGIWKNNTTVIYGSLIFDFLVSILAVWVMDFNYNGIFFLVFASTISYAKGEKGKYLIICMALGSYLLTDFELLSIHYRLYSIYDYINYYSATAQQYLLGIYNILVSLNIVLFIIYCILLIQKQKGTIAEVNMLYEEIRKTNADLQNANSQLEEYAKITERMGETKERNRLAREIHDTLGHTLTGISVGIDACIATVEQSPKEAKKHLELISGVARDGLLDIRRSVNELKPDSLERFSLEASITKMITDMKSITDMQIFFECKVKPLRFDKDEESAVYRVIQESLTNAMRHGKASQVWIVIEKEEEKIILTIRDNGVGCADMKNGFGTRHIMERIDMLHGTVEFKSENGFTVTAKIPIRWGEEYD